MNGAMEGPNLTQHEIIKFLTLKGGRCTNFELVSNFRGALNHPQHQAEARLKFKDIVNTVATVGEYQNVKYIELKKEYSDNNLLSESPSSQPSSLSSDSGSSYTSPLTQSFQPYWRYRLSTSTKVPTLPVRSADYDSFVRQQASSPTNSQLERSVSESTLPESVSDIQPPPRTRGRSASGFNRSVSANPSEKIDSQLRNSNYLGDEYLSRRSSINGYPPQQENFNSPSYSSVLPSQQRYTSQTESIPGDTRRHSATFVPERPPRSQCPPSSRRNTSGTSSEFSRLSHSRSFSNAHSSLPPNHPQQAVQCNSSNNLDGWKTDRPLPSRNGSERSPKRTGICSDDMLKELEEDSPPQYTENSISRSFERMHGIVSENRSSYSGDTSYSSLPDYSFSPGNKPHYQSSISHNNVENKHGVIRNDRESVLPVSRNLFPNAVGESNSFGADNTHVRDSSLDYDTASVSSKESTSAKLENEVRGNWEGASNEKQPANRIVKDDDAVPVPPERRRKHSKSTADIPKENDVKPNMSQPELSSSTGKVKDRVQLFDDLEKKKNHLTKRGPSSPLPDKENRSSKTNLMEDDVSISVLDPKLKREWFVKAAQGDYYALVGLLKKEPKLAAIKDIATFTALHWAAKHGDANIVKLIAGSYRVNPNIRSGYTPIHLATLYKHTLIVDLLVHTYGADASLRDYSGKRADQYPENYIRTVAGLKTVERKPLKARPLERESTVSAFIRIGSLNLRKSRKSTVFASVRGRNWGSATELRRLNNYKSTRKKNSKNTQPEKKCEAESKNDSDSDSAYGFNSK